jgi:hypothetical protein
MGRGGTDEGIPVWQNPQQTEVPQRAKFGKGRYFLAKEGFHAKSEPLRHPTQSSTFLALSLPPVQEKGGSRIQGRNSYISVYRRSGGMLLASRRQSAIVSNFQARPDDIREYG